VNVDRAPIVDRNRAIAVAELDGPELALATVDQLERELSGYHAFHAHPRCSASQARPQPRPARTSGYADG